MMVPSNILSLATPLLTERRISKATPSENPHDEWYKITLTAADAIEIHINNLTHPSSCVEVYDQYGTRLERSAFTAGSPLIMRFFPSREGCYFIKLTIGPDPDPTHLCQLFVDKYTRLSGTVSGSLRLSADTGPYLLGPDDVIISAGCSVTVEAGTTLNVRGNRKIVVRDSGTLSLCGEATRPITIIGATGDPANHRWDQLEASTQAVTFSAHLIIQYDNDANGADFPASPAPFVAAASSLQEFTSTIEEAMLIKRAGIIPPPVRLDYIKTWFQQVSPYHFSFLEEILPFELYFGNDVTTFADWEIDSLRVSHERYESGHINYWDFVNGNFTSDLAEAAQLFASQLTSPEPRIQRLIDFLALGQNFRQTHGTFRLYDLINPFNDEEDEEFQRTFERMASAFWYAHNTSIVYWDKMARELGLWDKEDELEQQFINSVIIRVHFAADLPFTIPGYGNNIPPVGFLGIVINHGPFRYPKEYPIPEPEHEVNYGTLSTAAYLKFFFETLVKRKTNPLYTWWIPSQADDQLFRLLNEKGISIDSPPEDWDREFIQPSQKTLEEIQHYYLST